MNTFWEDVDLTGCQLENAQLHQITTLSDLPVVDGAIGFHSVEGSHRVAFRDQGALIFVPRLDRNENVTLQWNFAPTSAMAPFTLGSNALGQLVTGLNSDQLDGYHVASANTATTIPVRDAGGRMKASDPVDNLDVANKQWTLNTLSGALSRKQECKCGTKTNVNISSPPTSIDGVSLSNGDRILLLGQTTASQNGIWIYNGSGVALTRGTDADEDAEVNPGMQVFIAVGGTVYGATDWMLITEEPITVGTTDLEFVQTAGSGQWQEGSGIEIDGLTVHVKIGSAGSPSGTTYAAKAIVQADTTNSLKQITLGTANQVLAMNSGASDYEHKSIVGTSGEIEITHTAGQIEIGFVNPIPVNKGGTGTSTEQTQGRVIFAGAGGVFSGSDNFFWDNLNSRLGIRNDEPTEALEVHDGGIVIQHNTQSGQLKINSYGTTQHTASNIVLSVPSTVDTDYAGFQLAQQIIGTDGGSMRLVGQFLKDTGSYQATAFDYYVDESRWRFWTGGAVRMYVKDVGVGVLREPTNYALEVNGVINGKRYGTGFSWAPNTKTAAIFEGSSSGTSINIVSPNGQRSGVWFGRAAAEADGRVEYDQSWGRLEFWTGGAVRGYVNNAGYFGVGTFAQTYHLEVAGTAQAYNYRAVSNTGTTYFRAIRTDSNSGAEESYISLENTASGTDVWKWAKRGATYSASKESILYYNGADGIKTFFNFAPTGELRIAYQGNVAVGNIFPVTKLDVDGDIRGSSIKLDRGSSDTITLAAPSGLASDLTFTWPGTIPGAGYMRSDESGNMSITTTLDATVLTGTVPAGTIPQGAVTQHQAAIEIDWSQITTGVPTSFTPAAHILATTSGLGPEHTVSGLTAGQVLIATGSTTMVCRALQASDLPTDLDGSTTIGGAKAVFGGSYVLSASTTQTITHNLGTQNVFGILRDTNDNSMDFVSVENVNDNQSSISFREAPANGRFVLILFGQKE